jgi:hypothetical protein
LRDRARYGHFLEGFVNEWLEILEPLLIEAGCPPSSTADVTGDRLDE